MARSAKTSAPSNPAAPAAATVAPLSTVLMAVATEVRELAVAADGLQDLVGNLISDPLAMTDARAIERGQALDAVVQRLQALELFLSTLAPSVKPEWSVDTRPAAELLLLAGVAQRLSGVAVEVAREDRGECDFF